jgi:CRP-like cAMP-binding protein
LYFSVGKKNKDMSADAKIEFIDPEWSNFFRQEIQLSETVEEGLARVPILSLLDESELKIIAQAVHLRSYATGEPVIRRGVEQSGFYLVRRGSVNIVRERSDGQQEVVANLGVNELLSEFALVDGTPRTSSIVAGEPSELIGFFKPDLMDMMVTIPVLGCKIVLRLAEEMCQGLNKDYARLQDYGYPFPDSDEDEEILDLTQT